GIGVAGYFYVTAYGPAWMRLTPRPVDHRALVASCDEATEVPIAGAALGWVSFGGAARDGDDDGFNPCRDLIPTGKPEVFILAPADGQQFEDDNIIVHWDCFDPAAPDARFTVSHRVDNGPWIPGGHFSMNWLIDVPVGHRRLEVRAVNADGVTGTASVHFDVLNHVNDPPHIAFVDWPRVALGSGAPVRISWRSWDEFGDLDDVEYRVYFSPWDERGGYRSSVEHPIVVTRDPFIVLEDLPANLYYIHVIVIDAEGTRGEVGTLFRTDGGHLDYARDVDSRLTWASAPEPGATLTDPDITISWTMDRWTKVQWRVDGGAWSDPSTDMQHQFSFPEVGEHRIDLREFWDIYGVPELPWAAAGGWSWPPLSATFRIEPPAAAITGLSLA
ncbi:MAG: hypothetical protein FD129_2331, partial [bacterium]